MAVAVVLLIGGGELALILDSHSGYGSHVSFSENAVQYTLTSDGSNSYEVVVLDNGSFAPNSAVYIYYDSSYGSAYVAGGVPLGSRDLDQAYYVELLTKNLAYRGVTATVIGAAALAELMGMGTGCAVIIVSGALPSTVYTGCVSDPVFSWLEDGGRLYWAGNLLGAYSASVGSVTSVIGYPEQLFGFARLNRGNDDEALNVCEGNDLREQLSIQNNRVRYAVDTSMIMGGSYLALGYTEGGYVSAVLTSYGGGQVCVLGGDYRYEQIEDLAQIVASGICYCSQVVGCAYGDMARETVTGEITVAGSTDRNLSAYVYYGGFRPVYGRPFNSV